MRTVQFLIIFCFTFSSLGQTIGFGHGDTNSHCKGTFVYSKTAEQNSGAAFITAKHCLVGIYSLTGALGSIASFLLDGKKPYVLYNPSKSIQAKINVPFGVAVGSFSGESDSDIAVLYFPKKSLQDSAELFQLARRKTSVCSDFPRISEPLKASTGKNAFRSSIAKRIKVDTYQIFVQAYHILEIEDGPHVCKGDSGGGVFRTSSGCLTGVNSTLYSKESYDRKTDGVKCAAKLFYSSLKANQLEQLVEKAIAKVTE